MLSTARLKRKQLIREAEGYLELMTLFDDRWPLALANRRELADRVVETLAQIENPQGFKPQILFLKGQAHRAAERYAQAVNLLEQSLRLDPENIHCFLALGWCYKRLNQMDLAVEALRGAIVLEPESAISHYNLACYLALTGNLKETIKHLAIAIDLDHKYRHLVAIEPDFDPVRETPEFQSLLSVSV